MVRRVQPGISSTEDHLADIVEAMMDVVARLWARFRFRLESGTADDSAADSIETVQGVKHRDGVRTWLTACICIEENEPVVGRGDERGPFGVGEGAVDGVVYGFFGDEGEGGGGDGEMEKVECGVVFDVDWEMDALRWACRDGE